MPTTLSGLDAIFLGAEVPGSPMHMMGILVLDPATMPGGYEFERFRAFLAERARSVPLMCRRLVQGPFGIARPCWVVDPGLDLDPHIRRAAVPSPGGDAELAIMAAELEEIPLDRSRPLWQMVVVEGLAGGRIALLAKVHHAMMDGVAGMQFMTTLFSEDPVVEQFVPALVGEIEAEAEPGALELLARGAASLAGRPLLLARAALGTLGATLTQSWRSLTTRAESEAVSDVEPVEVERCCFNTRFGSSRKVGIASLSLDDVRAVAAAHSVKLNDVVLAVVAGALRRELGLRDLLPEAPLVAAVPVSTHRDDDEDSGNSISVAFMGLATDIADPIERLRKIRSGSKRAKRRQGSVVGDSLSAWSEVFLPIEVSAIARLYGQVVDRISPLCNVCVSNVPGPPAPLYLGGARLVGLHALGPIYDGLSLNVTVLSREDALDVGILTAGDALGDVRGFAEGLTTSLDELVKHSHLR